MFYNKKYVGPLPKICKLKKQNIKIGIHFGPMKQKYLGKKLTVTVKQLLSQEELCNHSKEFHVMRTYFVYQEKF